MSVDIGGRLRFVRSRHKLSQRELAKRSGVTNSTISLIESNQMNPSVGALKRILDGIPMGLAEFFAIEPERPRKAFYQGEAFDVFRFALFEHEPDRPERLEHPVFARPEPEEMLIDEVEAIWSAIDAADDWTPFKAKLKRIEETRRAYGFGVAATGAPAG